MGDLAVETDLDPKIITPEKQEISKIESLVLECLLKNTDDLLDLVINIQKKTFEVINKIERRYPDLYEYDDTGFPGYRNAELVSEEDQKTINYLYQAASLPSSHNLISDLTKFAKQLGADQHVLDNFNQRSHDTANQILRTIELKCANSEKISIAASHWLKSRGLELNKMPDDLISILELDAYLKKPSVTEEAKNFEDLEVNGETYKIQKEPDGNFIVDLPQTSLENNSSAKGHLRMFIRDSTIDVVIWMDGVEKKGKPTRSGQKYAERGLRVAREFATNHNYSISIDCSNPILVHAVWKVFGDLLKGEEIKYSERAVLSITESFSFKNHELRNAG